MNMKLSFCFAIQSRKLDISELDLVSFLLSSLLLSSLDFNCFLFQFERTTEVYSEGAPFY